jgi:cell wall-associated NlpC family hydrolase
MDRYVGIPYRAGGRDFCGIDCWGLVRLVYDEELGIELPTYDGIFAGKEDAHAAGEVMATESRKWQQVQRWQPFDVLLLRLGAGIPTHVAVYLGNGLMLHALDGADSTIERTDSLKWRKRIQGAYRHAGNRQAA